ncbi:MAG: hypothetical protein IPM23_02850 [Candidatus Melainabacteria bacterium]|nr:hypothetical protein [Candidatus Melainabacteria bacterium]
MRAYDAHIEQSLRDSGLDRGSGESLSREGNHLSSLMGQRERSQGKNLSFMDMAGGWQRDDRGNAVIMGRGGRLLTRDDQGRTVDYSSHLENKRMASRDQMAFTSVLFCSPLMLFGMGATFAFMDQFHSAGRDKNYQDLKEKLGGPRAGASQPGCDSRSMARAFLLGSDRRQLSLQEQFNHSAMQNARLEQEIKDRRKKRISDQVQAQPLSRPAGDRSMASRRKLVKMKERLEEQLERMRGHASLEDVAKIESQLERLDRSLKRMSALGL